MSSSVSVYPVLKTEQEVQELINSTINDKNAKIVKAAVQVKQASYTHYNKVISNWAKWKNTFIYALGITSVMCDLASTIYNILIDVGITTNSVIPEISYLVTIVLIAPMIMLLSKYCSVNITKYNNICVTIKECIDKVYILWNKAIVDSVITDDELKLFQNIFNATDQVVKQDETDIAKNNADMLSKFKSIFAQGIETINSIESTTPKKTPTTQTATTVSVS